MSSRETLPARLLPPSVHRAVPRIRLFEAIRSEPDRTLVWLSGPAGSGKSTLVATYLADEGVPSLWYRTHDGDSSPAAFFSDLAKAVAVRSRKRRRKLPLLLEERGTNVATFARTFFASLFAAMPERTHLVVDSYEQAATNELDEILIVAAENAPPGSRILVTSREAPNRTFSHLVVMGQLHLIGWDALRLTCDEASAIAVSRKVAIEPDGMSALHARTNGWVAGLVVMLRRHPRASGAGDVGNSADQDALFEYFAHEFLERTDAETRAVLLRTAVMQHFDADQAQSLCPEADADIRLRSLYRRHYFLERLVGPGSTESPRYRYHDLFREYLLRESAHEIVGADRVELLRRAANAHRKQGQIEEAIALYTEAGDWDALSDALCMAAPAWLRQGRNRTLVAAIGELPDEVLEASPWLLFWLGNAELPIAQSTVITRFESAYNLFCSVGDDIGRLQACCAALRCYTIVWGELRSMDVWGERIHRHLMEIRAMEVDDEIRVLAALENLCFRPGRHRALLEHAYARTLELIPRCRDPEALALAASFCRMKSEWFDFGANEEPGFLRESEAHLDADGVSPLISAVWSLNRSMSLSVLGRSQEASRHLEKARRIAVDLGSLMLDMEVDRHVAYERILVGDLEHAVSSLERRREKARRNRAIDIQSDMGIEASQALALGDYELARRLAASVLRQHEVLGYEWGVAEARVCNAYCLLIYGELDVARSEMDLLEEQINSSGLDYLRYSVALIRASASLRSGAVDRARDEAGVAIGHARRRGAIHPHPFMPDIILRPILLFALREGIEPTYVKNIIRTMNLPPPSDADAHWPWPIRVRTLGRFQIEVEDAPLGFPRKTPRKPIELLKALIGLGGRDVREDRLVDALWPELHERDSDEKKALEVTLHRLRKLLGNAEAITLHNGLVSLNPVLVWTDVRELEALLARHASWRNAEGEGDASGRAFEDVELLTRELRTLLDTYQGPFLQEEPECVFTLPLRQRLAAGFRDRLLRLGMRLEALGEDALARHAYERGIAIDALAESLYRQLVSCCLRDGNPAGAIEAYRRCRDMLSIVLGVKPSRELEALYRRAIDAG